MYIKLYVLSKNENDFKWIFLCLQYFCFGYDAFYEWVEGHSLFLSKNIVVILFLLPAKINNLSNQENLRNLKIEQV